MQPVVGPVVSIVRAVHAGTRTAREVVEEYLETAEAKNPDLNAFTELDPDGALRRADLVDAGSRAGSLAGVPIALKDLIDHAGHTTTAGSAFYRNQAAVSAPVVERLEAAGAIIMGRTGLDEFAYGGSSENPWFGAVRNPWDRDLSPGGSSGGSAAAVSSGMAPAAIGTDTGGSVRVPAALCGVVGLKVTHGRVPLTGVFPLAASMDTVGPITTTCGDARLVYRAMKGFDGSDPWSDPRDRKGCRPRSLDRIRVAVPVDWLEWVPTSNRIRTSFETFCERLRETGPRVEPLRDPALVPDPIRAALSAAEAAATHRAWIDDPDKPYGSEVRERVETAIRTTIDDYTRARRWRAGIVQAARRMFSEYDLDPDADRRPQPKDDRGHRDRGRRETPLDRRRAGRLHVPGQRGGLPGDLPSPRPPRDASPGGAVDRALVGGGVPARCRGTPRTSRTRGLETPTGLRSRHRPRPGGECRAVEEPQLDPSTGKAAGQGRLSCIRLAGDSDRADDLADHSETPRRALGRARRE